MQIVELLKFALTEGASDLHLTSQQPPRLRIHGEMRSIEVEPLSRENVHEMIFDVMTDHQRSLFQERLEIDFSYELGGAARFRVNAFNQRCGEGAVFRAIPSQVASLEELGLPPILGEICDRERGLVLVTGPTGSGKSTTLAAMIDHINRRSRCHILTIEDPIEFVHESKLSLLNQREVGPHTKSFAAALRSALREDPDVILVGEMRDIETIALAITAAETGHLVFGTLHTSSAAKTVDRVIDVFPAEQQAQIRTMFAESIEAIVSQTLCAKTGGGRIAALEILIGTPAVRNLIREGKGHQIPSAMQTGQKFGMQTLAAALDDLVARNLVSPEEARRKGQTDSIVAAPGPLAARAPKPAAMARAKVTG